MADAHFPARPELPRRLQPMNGKAADAVAAWCRGHSHREVVRILARVYEPAPTVRMIERYVDDVTTRFGHTAHDTRLALLDLMIAMPGRTSNERMRALSALLQQGWTYPPLY